MATDYTPAVFTKVIRRSERWRDVPGYEGRYQVSDRGNVSSYPTGRRTYKKVLKPKIQKRGKGYRCVALIRADGHRWDVFISRLVLMAFVGPCPDGMEVCHGAAGSLNDHVRNLRWDTHASNIRDKWTHGTMPVGSTHHQSKLQEPEVVAIQRELRAGVKGTTLARKYGVDVATISNINVRKTWRHV